MQVLIYVNLNNSVKITIYISDFPNRVRGLHLKLDPKINVFVFKIIYNINTGGRKDTITRIVIQVERINTIFLKFSANNFFV